MHDKLISMVFLLNIFLCLHVGGKRLSSNVKSFLPKFVSTDLLCDGYTKMCYLYVFLSYMGKVFKNGPNLWKTSFENLKEYALLKQTISLQIKGCLPQISLGPFLNTLAHKTKFNFSMHVSFTKCVFSMYFSCVRYFCR